MRLLHIEDDPDIREITKLSLEYQGGFEVFAAANGKQALEILDEARPELCLIDMMMPEMTGAEVCSAIRQRPGYAEMPVVFMTARPMEQDSEELGDCHVLGVVAKPFDPMSLGEKLREMIERREHPRPA